MISELEIGPDVPWLYGKIFHIIFVEINPETLLQNRRFDSPSLIILFIKSGR